jgi:hypothetical protein
MIYWSKYGIMEEAQCVKLLCIIVLGAESLWSVFPAGASWEWQGAARQGVTKIETVCRRGNPISTKSNMQDAFPALGGLEDSRGGLSGVSPLLQWRFDSRITVHAPDHSCTWHENVVWQLRVHQNYWPSRKLAFEELTMVGIAKLTSPCEFIGSEKYV